MYWLNLYITRDLFDTNKSAFINQLQTTKSELSEK